ARQRGRRPAQQVAAETIAWGEPVLPTEISAIVDGRLMLRGEDAIALAETATLEDIARHLWQASRRPDLMGTTDLGAPGLRSAYRAMAELAATQMPTPGRARAVLIDEAEAALATMATALAGPGGAPMHERLAACWGRPEAADPLRRALVLLAEHELNASTFAARVTASTGAPPRRRPGAARPPAAPAPGAARGGPARAAPARPRPPGRPAAGRPRPRPPGGAPGRAARRRPGPGAAGTNALAGGTVVGPSD